MQVVVVLSGSMEPAYYRGDILFLNMGRRPVRVGEVVVFNIEGRDIPIVHRVVKVHERRPGAAHDEIEILTKARPCRPAPLPASARRLCLWRVPPAASARRPAARQRSLALLRHWLMPAPRSRATPTMATTMRGSSTLTANGG